MKHRTEPARALQQVICVLAACVAAALATVCVRHWLIRHHETEAQKCRQTLKALWSVCELYRSEEGVPPPSLDALITDNYLDIPLGCPSVRDGDGHSDHFAGYIYVDCSGLDLGVECSHGRRPRITDRLGNHHPSGVNIVFEDGCVSWVDEAEALGEFFRKHEESQRSSGDVDRRNPLQDQLTDDNPTSDAPTPENGD